MVNNLSIGKQIGLGFGLVLLLLAVVAGWSIVGIGGIVENATEVIDGNELRGAMTQREVDHLNWAAELNSLLTDESVTTLAVQTDPHKCGFGQWYYSDSRKEAEALVPELKELFVGIEKPHVELHNSAVEIGELFHQADIHLPTFLAEKEVDHLKWVNACLKLFVENLEKLEIQTDDHKCSLGKFLHGEKGREVAAADTQLALLIEALKEPHSRLHKSAIGIQEQWDNTDEAAMAAAHEVFANETLPSLAETQAALNSLKERAIAMVEGMNRANAVFAAKTKPSLEEVQAMLGGINKATEENIMTDEQMLSAALSTRTAVLVFSCIAGAIGLALAFFIARGIVRALTQVIQGLTQGSEQVASASGQVAQSSQQMAQGASEQASSLEETSSSLEEMASITKQNADNAKQANSLATVARDATEKGQDSMRRMSEAINKIKASSDETAKIVKTIDEIAFQTNLLALNAAVEAARAGDAGKGFAVVAEEVRNLAQRSADAAKSTSELIEGSRQNAENGVAVSGEVEEILRQIAEGVQKVAGLIGEVSIAGNEQSQGIEQVNVAVAQMDSITQSNAANAEESASASEELSAQAKELNEMVESLIRIVGGAAATRNGRAAGSIGHNGLQTPPCRGSVPQRTDLALAAIDHTDKKIIKPEEVIPMGDDELEGF